MTASKIKIGILGAGSMGETHADRLLGPPQSLSAVAAIAETGRPGEITALLRYASGASAVVTGNGIMPRNFPYTVGFRAVLDAAAIEHRTVFMDDIPESSLLCHTADGLSAPLRIQRDNPYERELRHCIGCMRNGHESDLLGAENALAALRLSIATQRSLRNGTTVHIR